MLAFEGDSISVWPPEPTDYVNLTRGVFSPYSASPNFATGGATIATITARAATTDAAYDATRFFNILSVFIGANNLRFGESDTTIFNALKAYCQARRAAGWQVVLATMLPSNADACAAGGCETTRLSVNSMIRADPSFYDALADIGATSTTMGNYAAVSDATYYEQTAGLHPTNPVGQALLAPFFQAAVHSLIPVVP